MGSEELVPRVDEYCSTGRRTGGGKGRGIQSVDRNRLLGINIPVANTTLGTNPHATLAYATHLEIYHQNMSILGGHGGQIQIEREREIK